MDKASAPRRSPLDVFRYLDYRVFLKALYEAQKSRGMSYRAFAKRAQLGAPNYLKLVIDGQRNLTPGMAERFAAACGLSDEASRYFCVLVAFCQADDADEKALHHKQLLSFRRYRDAHKLEAAHADYHADWYLPAIRELVTSQDFVEDPRWIARKLQPPIKSAQATSALATLRKLGLLAHDESGRLRQTSAVVTTGAETRGVHITAYHAEMMRRATAAMDLVPNTERDISSLTLCVSPATLKKLKARVQEMRRELLALAEQEEERSQVVQLNIQLFPLSQAALPGAPQPSKAVPKRNKSGASRTEKSHDDE